MERAPKLVRAVSSVIRGICKAQKTQVATAIHSSKDLRGTINVNQDKISTVDIERPRITFGRELCSDAMAVKTALVQSLEFAKPDLHRDRPASISTSSFDKVFSSVILQLLISSKSSDLRSASHRA